MNFFNDKFAHCGEQLKYNLNMVWHIACFLQKKKKNRNFKNFFMSPHVRLLATVLTIFYKTFC